jgi:hypothetical protein
MWKLSTKMSALTCTGVWAKATENDPNVNASARTNPTAPQLRTDRSRPAFFLIDFIIDHSFNRYFLVFALGLGV